MTDVAARSVKPTPPADGPDAGAITLSAGEWSRIAESWAKRALDILGAAVAILIFLPLLMSIALIVRLESGGPVIFKQ